MRTRTVTLPELASIAGTRVALGAGIGLLLADRLSSEQRKAAGCALLTFGVLSTIPLVLAIGLRREGNGQDHRGLRRRDEMEAEA